VCFTLAWLRGDDIRLPAESSDLSRSSKRYLWLHCDPTDVLELIAYEPTQFVGADISRLESIVSIALTVREHPHPPASAAVYPFAAHDADLVATIAPAAVMYGSMHLYAGILAKAAGEPERAVDHLRRSAEMNTRIGAAPFLALTLHELAKALGEGEEARQAHNKSQRLARQIGIPWLS
jgi:hypothetical protein